MAWLDSIDDDKTKAQDKLIKARVRMQRENPFFAYLVLALKMYDSDKVPSAGVNMDGEMCYNQWKQ